jgi:hypothetical protein
MIVATDWEVSMCHLRVVAIAALGFVLGGHPVLAEGPFQYREYALESSAASIAKRSGARESDITTSHERPAKIQELEWRAPYARSESELADPVRDVLFRFYDDQLYQVVVTYDRDRMEGLTNDDVIEPLSAIYGVPLLRHARAAGTVLPADVLAEATVVAQWEDANALLMLTRSTYSPQLQLVLISKTLNERARAAIKEALRLDRQEAPQRELDQRKKEAADARMAGEKARVVNKAAFKP